MGDSETLVESMVIKLGTRGSRLALAQATAVAAQLHALFKVKVEIVTVKTLGDQITDKPLREIGTQGLFTKELDEALLDGRIDVALHCLKDMPTTKVKNLEIAAYLPREEIHDCLVFPNGYSLATAIESLPSGFRIGTSAIRRKAQILRKNPGVSVLECRGNLDTRVEKLLTGEVDALCLAKAGLSRSALTKDARLLVVDLSERDFYPCAGQGCLVLQVTKSSELKKIMKRLNHKETEICVKYERDLLALLEGGCSLPLGVFSEIVDGEMILKAILLSEDGKEFVTLSQATRDLKDPLIAENILTEIRERNMHHLLPG